MKKKDELRIPSSEFRTHEVGRHFFAGSNR